MAECKACRGKGTMRGFDGKFDRFVRVQCIHCLGTGRELTVFQRRLRVRPGRGGIRLSRFVLKWVVLTALVLGVVVWVALALL